MVATTDTRSWVTQGTQLFLDRASALDDTAMGAPSLLPGWTRRHVTAHVAANADAMRNLVHWARTGEATPMYSSPGQRLADIEAGAQRSAADLVAWCRTSAADLAADLDALTDEQWGAEVRTAQGRTVPATELPWMRAREVCIHAIDLDDGLSFVDLPRAFLNELVEEIRVKRGLEELPEGPLADVAAWLAGRPHALAGAPEIGPWL